MRYSRIATALACSTGGAVTFSLIGMPLPLLLGPMAGCLVAALAGAKLEGVGLAGALMRTVLGVAVGASITPDLIKQLPQYAPSLAVVPVLVAISGATGFILFRRLGFDRPTAYYSAMPGGLQDMLILGEAAGGDVRALSLIHATRVLLIFALVPLAAAYGWGIDFAAAPGQPASSLAPRDGVAMTVAALVGWAAAWRLGIPGASIIGPMVLAAILSLAGLLTVRPPVEAIWAAQFVIGLGVGVRYVGVTAQEVRKDILSGFLYSLCLGLISVGMFLLVARDDLDLATLLALLPGGQAEMALIAIIAGVDVAFVVAHHVFRIMIVILCAQTIERWLRP